MSNRQDPAEQLLDVLVYAPLGLLMEARELVPKLADKGRQRMGGQVTVARMIGEMAVRQGQRQAERVFQRLREQPAPAPTSGATETAARPTNGHGSAPVASATSTPTSTASPAPEAGTLAIPGYDTLSASQVLPRLEGLSAGELEAVRLYEESSRARKTVLTRIDQLRGGAQ